MVDEGASNSFIFIRVIHECELTPTSYIHLYELEFIS